MPTGLFFGCRRQPRINVGEFGDLPESGGCSGDEMLKIDTYINFCVSSIESSLFGSVYFCFANQKLYGKIALITKQRRQKNVRFCKRLFRRRA